MLRYGVVAGCAFLLFLTFARLGLPDGNIAASRGFSNASEIRRPEPAGSTKNRIDAQGSAVSCEPARYDDWSNDCAQIVASADVLFEPESVPTKVMITYDGEVLRISAAIPLDYHHRFFTTTPPTLVEFEGEHYVADSVFFNDNSPPVLQVNDERVALKWDGMPHWRVPQGATDRLIAALQHAASAKLEYSHLGHGKGQRVTISTVGFLAALTALPGSRLDAIQAESPNMDPAGIVGGHIGTNKLGIRPDELRSVANPEGAGHFIFVPRTRYHGVERKIVWFVNGGVASALNGPSRLVTPDLPVPREAAYAIWKDSNLSVNDVTSTGLATAFPTE